MDKVLLEAVEKVEMALVEMQWKEYCWPGGGFKGWSIVEKEA